MLMIDKIYLSNEKGVEIRLKMSKLVDTFLTRQ